MITVNQALTIHSALIDRFGGAFPLRDRAALEAALMRPYQTFESKDLYPSATRKAAALIESIVVNHPFIDGNKRTGYVIMRLLLLSENHDIEASQQEKFDFVIAIASGHFKYDDILSWLDLHVMQENGT